MDGLTEIRRGIDMMYKPGDVIECRIPRNKDDKFSAVMSGHFRDHGRLAECIDAANTEYKATIYTTLNPLKPDVFLVDDTLYASSRAFEEALKTQHLPLETWMSKGVAEGGREFYSMPTAKGADILKRSWILVDVDGGQPTGTNSSNQEHDDALRMVKAVQEYIQANGFPAPAVADSGNGYHCLVRVDLPNDNAANVLVYRFLKALIQRFNGKFGKASIDERVFDPSRITKAYGSMVFKGEHTEERPQRRSHIVEVASPRFAAQFLIEEIAAEYKLAPDEISSYSLETKETLDKDTIEADLDELKGYLDRLGIEYEASVADDKYIKIPCHCPNAEEHTMDGGPLECVASVRLTGGFGFCCQHSHCGELRSWRGMKRFMERRGKSTGSLMIRKPKSTT